MLTDVTWIVVANKAAARFFKCDRPSEGIHQFHLIEDPLGRLQDKELRTDRPGRGSGVGSDRHAFSPHEDPEHRVMADFARSIAAHLNHEFAERKFYNLILVGPPKMLSLIQGSLNKATSHSVVGTLQKNLHHSDEIDIAQHLDLLLRQGYRGRLYESKSAV
jgi:protein required for attachment to host cells